MTKLRTIFSLCVLCAFAVLAFAAQGAAAQTAFTCVAGGFNDFSDSHCTTPVAPGTGFFGHQAITSETSITMTNLTTGTERSTAKLKSVQSGVTLELQSTELVGTGKLVNVEEGGEMFAKGTGVLKLKSVTVTQPAGKGCAVVGGEVVTNELSATTKGLTNELKLSAKTGEIITELTITGCSVSALNHVYKASGSIRGKTEGATNVFTHPFTTEQKTFILSGQNGGLEGRITIRGENGSGLALT